MTKNDYKNWDKDELIKEIERLRKRKKYGLVWEDDDGSTYNEAPRCKQRGIQRKKF